MNAEDSGGLGLIAAAAVENLFDEPFLELRARFLKNDAAIHHLTDERFQLVFHGFPHR